MRSASPVVFSLSLLTSHGNLARLQVLQGGLSNEAGFFVNWFNGDWCIQSGFFCYKKVWWFDLLSHQSRHPKYISGDSWPVYMDGPKPTVQYQICGQGPRKKNRLLWCSIYGVQDFDLSILIRIWSIYHCNSCPFLKLCTAQLEVFSYVAGRLQFKGGGGFSSLTRCYKMPHWLQLWKPFGISWDMWGEAWLRMVDSG